MQVAHTTHGMAYCDACTQAGTAAIAQGRCTGSVKVTYIIEYVAVAKQGEHDND